MNFKPQDNISKHFTYREALWLPTWNRMGNTTDGLNDDVIARLQFLTSKMDAVREYFDASVNVHVCWRPAKYNAEIGGAPNSAHCAPSDMIAAMDFDVEGLTCDDAKAMILKDNKLEEWGMRMEDNGDGAHWIHLDTRPILSGHPRFFKP
jgi:hypothetical protein